MVEKGDGLMWRGVMYKSSLQYNLESKPGNLLKMWALLKTSS